MAGEISTYSTSDIEDLKRGNGPDRTKDNDIVDGRKHLINFTADSAAAVTQRVSGIVLGGFLGRVFVAYPGVKPDVVNIRLYHPNLEDVADATDLFVGVADTISVAKKDGFAIPFAANAVGGLMYGSFTLEWNGNTVVDAVIKVYLEMFDR